MTVRQVLEYALVETNKVGAPSLLREDFIYLLNKAITNYVNKRYNIYEETQQLTDDLRVLTQPASITNLTANANGVFLATSIGTLPQEYMHLLNCSAEFEYNLTYDNKGCLIKSNEKFKGVKRMTSQMYSGLIDNYYLKPSPKNPYYYLRNSSDVLVESVARTQGDRDGNSSPVNIEIIFGNDISKYKLKKILVDYLRVPKYMTITESQMESLIDDSLVMEFPYYVCLEIIKELVALLLENTSDTRLQTNIPINQAIPSGSTQSQGRSR